MTKLEKAYIAVTLRNAIVAAFNKAEEHSREVGYTKPHDRLIAFLVALDDSGLTIKRKPLAK